MTPRFTQLWQDHSLVNRPCLTCLTSRQAADLQFQFQDQDNEPTWQAFGGQGNAHEASREQPIAVAEKVQAEQGWSAWPACSNKLGLT